MKFGSTVTERKMRRKEGALCFFYGRSARDGKKAEKKVEESKEREKEPQMVLLMNEKKVKKKYLV